MCIFKEIRLDKLNTYILHILDKVDIDRKNKDKTVFLCLLKKVCAKLR